MLLIRNFIKVKLSLFMCEREKTEKIKKHRKQDEKLKNSFNLPLTIKITLQQQNEKQ